MTDPRYQKILDVAIQLFDRKPDWSTYFRELLGVNGLVRRTFLSRDDLVGIQKSEEFARIQTLLTHLREQRTKSDEATRVITVRMPISLLESLHVEAHEHRTSMQKLCVSKLLQPIESGFIPAKK